MSSHGQTVGKKGKGTFRPIIWRDDAVRSSGSAYNLGRIYEVRRDGEAHKALKVAKRTKPLELGSADSLESAKGICEDDWIRNGDE